MFKNAILSESRVQEISLMRGVYKTIKDSLKENNYGYIGLKEDFKILYNELFLKLESFVFSIVNSYDFDNYDKAKSYIIGFTDELMEEYFSEYKSQDDYIDEKYKEIIGELSTLILKLENEDLLNINLIFGVDNKYLISKRDMICSNNIYHKEYIDNYEKYLSINKSALLDSISIKNIDKVLIERAYIYNKKYSLINSLGEVYSAFMIPAQSSNDEDVFYQLYLKDDSFINCDSKKCNLENIKSFRGGDISSLSDLRKCNYKLSEVC